MPEPEEPLPEVYVQPGESHLVPQPTVLRTVLGSCVGVTFLVPRLGIGALCHPMLPRWPAHRLPGLSVFAGRRYVDFAIRDMAHQLDKLGAHRRETEVKLFGGADVLSVGDGFSRPTVGKLNCESAIKVLDEEGFIVSACSLGGDSGVHIQFETGTGEVLLRRLDSSAKAANPKTRREPHRRGRRH